jgi:hypothetical protein
MVAFLVYFCVCLSVPISLSIVLFLIYHRLYIITFSGGLLLNAPLISFDNDDHSNITYLASTFILDYEVIGTHISSIDLFAFVTGQECFRRSNWNLTTCNRVA